MKNMTWAWATLWLLLHAAAFGANLPPDFNQSRWDALITQAERDGTEIKAANGALKYLQRIVPPDTQVTHQANYFSVRGKVSGENFSPIDASETSETWLLQSDGEWRIEQWVYLISLAGDLLEIDHGILLETPQGEVFGDYLIPTGPVDSANELQHWGAQLGEWF